MKEYVEVPPQLLADTNRLKKYMVKSYQYVAGLPSRPTRKS
jgi:hypothetical protein